MACQLQFRNGLAIVKLSGNCMFDDLDNIPHHFFEIYGREWKKSILFPEHQFDSRIGLKKFFHK